MLQTKESRYGSQPGKAWEVGSVFFETSNFYWSIALLLSHFCRAQLFATPWTIAQVAPGVKNLPANEGDTRDTGSSPGSGSSPGEGNGNPLKQSCLENSMD